LIFGSSRAVNIFNPAVMEKELNLSCFNAGRIGQSIFYHYAVLKTVLKRYKPQKIILSFDAGNFDKDQEDYDRLSSLLPYYESNPEIELVINLKGPYEKIKMISSIYPFNSLLLPILNGNIKKDNSYYSNIKGFMANKKTTGSPARTIDYTKKEELDSKKIEIYKAFISECNNAGIELKDLMAIAVSQGPGSYTGLRIGVSAAKGLCYALNIPLIAVDTLQTLASQVTETDGLIFPMIDALKMES